MAPFLAQDHTTAQLAIVFGCVALALAAAGLFGVLSYGIALRTGDFDAITQIESVTTPNYWSRSGIMLRETLTGPSRNVFAWSSPDTGAKSCTGS